MQEYLHRSRLGMALDELGFHLAALIACLGWFCLLWGVRLPALAAGGALFTLLTLLRNRARTRRLHRREARLRVRIGGEMALERLITAPLERAQFEIALLLSMQEPMTMLQTDETGTLCRLKNETVLLTFAAHPLQTALDDGAVLACQRAARVRRADRAILCLPCPLSDAARAQAELTPRVSFLSKERLIALLGAANPASDAQLVALGARRKRKAPARRWLRSFRRREVSARYAFYGALLLSLYQLAPLPAYALPGCICLVLAAACHCRPAEKETL